MKMDDYYCRDCFKRTKDVRTHEARMRGLSVKCPDCGGICDPLAENVKATKRYNKEKLEQNARLRNKMRGK